MRDKEFNRVIGRIMEALEIAGVENQALKQQIKGYLWDLHDDMQKSKKEGNNESLISNN